MHPIVGTSETNPLLHVAANSASQPVVRHTVDRSFQSVKVITNLEGKEDIVAKWKLRSDGQLELPGSMPGATYFLAVYTSDENRVKIPTAVATGESEVVLPTGANLYSFLE